MKARPLFLRIALLLILVPAALSAQKTQPPSAGDDSDDDAVSAPTLRALADVEQTLLRQELDRYRKYVDLHRKMTQDIDQACARLDENLSKLQTGELGPSDLSDATAALSYLASDIRRQEDQLAGLIRDGAVIQERVRSHMTRLALYRERLGKEEEAAPPRPRIRYPLTGTWQMKILPGNVSATWTLRQTGTLVSGTYEMDGGRNGSFTGTLVDRKLAIAEIDSKYGKDANFYGTLSEDGTALRGTWEAMDLSGGRPGTGTWSGAKVTRPPAEPGPAGAAP